MCGIVGFWRFAKRQPADCIRLEKMSRAIAHRGPTDFGYLLADSKSEQVQVKCNVNASFTPDVLFASRRLSIHDLSDNANQPVGNETKDVFVVFNGAIHNFLELREQLEARGHIFRTQTDTEVIVHAYEEWGVECARHFNGMWAYVIWDAKKRRLICSRDRFGIKPLLIARQDKTFYFASEAKAIFAGGEISPTPDWNFLQDAITQELPVYVRRTAFANITQLPPAHNLIVTENGQWEAGFWKYDDRSHNYDFSQPETTFRELFSDSMRLRMHADVPIALLLSGGLDSSSIAAHTPKAKVNARMQAFTYTVPGYQNDERRLAEIVARQNGLELQGIEVSPAQFPDILSKVVWHMEDPPRHGQVIARWQLLQAASQNARIVLEGQGADEMLGGYPERYRGCHLQSEKARMTPGNSWQMWPRFLNAYFGLGTRELRSLRKLLALPAAPHRIPGRGILNAEMAATRGKPVECRLPSHFSGALTNQLWRDHSRLCLPYLLHFGDALSMAHAVESRLPFLDHRLVEFIFALPCDDKIRGRTTKHILRRAFKDKLPPSIKNNRSKIGFSTPLVSWIKTNLQNEIRPRLLSRQTRERGIFDEQALKRCCDEFENGENSAAIVLFRCLALENWCESFLDRNWN
jgi:asparagine synthase (glutamine-hydrolysing)